MDIFVKIEKNHYIDSLETLSETALLNDQPGIETGYIGMATAVFKEVTQEIGLATDELLTCSESDYVIVAMAESRDAFDAAVKVVKKETGADTVVQKVSYATTAAAAAANPKANLCAISVPGGYALEEVKKALNAGLHCVVFSNNVPLDQEREMKELAREKGLLCM